jgi:hypothetical protein
MDHRARLGHHSHRREDQHGRRHQPLPRRTGNLIPPARRRSRPDPLLPPSHVHSGRQRQGTGSAPGEPRPGACRSRRDHDIRRVRPVLRPDRDRATAATSRARGRGPWTHPRLPRAPDPAAHRPPTRLVGCPRPRHHRAHPRRTRQPWRRSRDLRRVGLPRHRATARDHRRRTPRSHREDLHAPGRLVPRRLPRRLVARMAHPRRTARRPIPPTRPAAAQLVLRHPWYRPRSADRGHRHQGHGPSTPRRTRPRRMPVRCQPARPHHRHQPVPRLGRAVSNRLA